MDPWYGVWLRSIYQIATRVEESAPPPPVLISGFSKWENIEFYKVRNTDGMFYSQSVEIA